MMLCNGISFLSRVHSCFGHNVPGIGSRHTRIKWLLRMNDAFFFFCAAAMFQVRSLQDLSRISIRHILKKSVSGSWPLPQKVGSRGRSRLKQRREQRDSTLLNNHYMFMSRLIPRAIDDNNNQSDSDDDDDDNENCRGICERVNDELGESEEGRRKEASVTEAPVNILRERILSLPLPEPLKTYLLYYREK